MGVARTFQNLALFKGMSVLDNIMTGRNLRIRATCSCRRCASGPPSARRSRTAPRSSASSTSWIQACRKTPVGRLPYGLQSASTWAARWPWSRQVLLLDEPMAGMNVEEKQDMCRFILDVNDEFGTTIVLIEHDMGVVMDISDRVVVLGLRQEDRRRHARRRCAAILTSSTPTWARVPTTTENFPWHSFSKPLGGRPDGRHAVFAFGGLVALGFVLIFKARRRVQLRAGRDGAVRRAGDGALSEWIPQWTGIDNAIAGQCWPSPRRPCW